LNGIDRCDAILSATLVVRLKEDEEGPWACLE